jgi:DNA topoisomerase-2
MEIIQGKMVVQNRKRNAVLEDLRKRNYASFPKHRKSKVSVATAQDEDSNSDNEYEDGQNDDNDHGYDYLLSMPIWNLTEEKAKKLKEELANKQKELDILLGKDTKDLWREDLSAFMVEWEVRNSNNNNISFSNI